MTEGEGLTIGVRCDPTCGSFRLPNGPSGAHAEGHVIFTP